MTIAPTLDTLRASLPGLCEEARRRGREFEDSRQLADDFTDRLKAAGAYRILYPSEFGGLGGALVDWFDMGLALAEADASTGWTVMHGAGANAIVQSLGDRGFARDVLSDPGACCAWSNAPSSVQAENTADGLRISARWSYVTGCMAATYVEVSCRWPMKPAPFGPWLRSSRPLLHASIRPGTPWVFRGRAVMTLSLKM